MIEEQYIVPTQVRTNNVHVSVVPVAVGGAVGVGEEGGGEVSDEGEGEEDGGAHHPAQLRYSPRQR